MKVLMLSLFLTSISGAALINVSNASDSFQPASKSLSNNQDRHLITRSNSATVKVIDLNKLQLNKLHGEDKVR